MPAQLLLVGNPARRRRAKSRKAPSAAQLRNRARFAAAARARRNPIRRTRSAAPATVANPHRRRRARVRHTRRARRNPIGGATLRGLMPMLKNAAYGGAGALASDIAYGYATPYLPATFASPLSGTGINPMYYLGKGALTVALGIAAKKFLGARAGAATEGALAVLLHDAMKNTLAPMLPSVPMGFMPGGQVLPPLPISQNLSKYVPTGPGLRPSMLRGLHAPAMLNEYVGLAAQEARHY